MNIPSQVLSLVQQHSHNTACGGSALIPSKMDPSTYPSIVPSIHLLQQQNLMSLFVHLFICLSQNGSHLPSCSSRHGLFITIKLQTATLAFLCFLLVSLSSLQDSPMMGMGCRPLHCRVIAQSLQTGISESLRLLWLYLVG